MRTTIYLPDALASAAKEAGINISAACQDALRRRLADDAVGIDFYTRYELSTAAGDLR